MTVDTTLLAKQALVITSDQMAQLGRGQERIVARQEVEIRPSRPTSPG